MLRIVQFLNFGVSFEFSLIPINVLSGFSAGFCANTSLCRGDCESLASHALQLGDTLVDYDALYYIPQSHLRVTYVVQRKEILSI